MESLHTHVSISRVKAIHILHSQKKQQENQMSADKDGSWQGSMGFAQFAAAGGEEDSSDEGEEEESTIKQQLIGRGMGSAHYAGGAKVKNITYKEVIMSS